MGDLVHLLADRQHSHLTATRPAAATSQDTGAPDPAVRFVVLTLLAVDGVLSAIAAVLLLPTYIGSIPFPISALVSGLVNVTLVWAAMLWTTSPRVAALPLWTWLLTVAVMAVAGTGGDINFDERGAMVWVAPLLLVGLGLAPPAFLLRRRNHLRGLAGNGRRPE